MTHSQYLKLKLTFEQSPGSINKLLWGHDVFTESSPGIGRIFVARVQLLHDISIPLYEICGRWHSYYLISCLN